MCTDVRTSQFTRKKKKNEEIQLFFPSQALMVGHVAAYKAAFSRVEHSITFSPGAAAVPLAVHEQHIISQAPPDLQNQATAEAELDALPLGMSTTMT